MGNAQGAWWWLAGWLVIAGCGGPAPTPASRAVPVGTAPATAATVDQGVGQPFVASWTWQNTAPGAAHIGFRLVPSVTGRVLTVTGRAPDGVSVVGGDFARHVAAAQQGEAIEMAFDVRFPPEAPPEIPIDVHFDVDDDMDGAYTYVVRDPDVPIVPAPPHPGREINMGNGPAKVAGTAEPQRK